MTSLPLQTVLMMIWLCGMGASSTVDVNNAHSQISGDLSGERELALVQHRKVSLPQGELQINDQGRRLSAGLHASCPIHRQTCQEALPPGISGIFTERLHHFCLLPIGSEH